jgi:hypothetical protein
LEQQKFYGQEIRFDLVDHIKSTFTLKIGLWDPGHMDIDPKYIQSRPFIFANLAEYDSMARQAIETFWDDSSNRPFLNYVERFVGHDEFEKLKSQLQLYNFAAINLSNSVVLKNGSTMSLSPVVSMTVYHDCTESWKNCSK